MTDYSSFGRAILFLGLLIAGVGLLLLVFGRIPFLGRLPGDIAVQRGSWGFYFPLATSIVLSLVLTVLLNLFFRR
jgi:membrane protein implicated in regulation of membrane protease activity